MCWANGRNGGLFGTCVSLNNSLLCFSEIVVLNRMRREWLGGKKKFSAPKCLWKRDIARCSMPHSQLNVCICHSSTHMKLIPFDRSDLVNQGVFVHNGTVYNDLETRFKRSVYKGRSRQVFMQAGQIVTKSQSRKLLHHVREH